MKQNLLAQLSRVTKRYGSVVALDGLDLEVRTGELLAVLGPNGAGKTTAISLLLGLTRPDAGSASLFGHSPHSIDARRQIGLMMQEVALAPDLRVREHVHLVSSYYPTPLTFEETLELTRTRELANRPYGKLSGGQKRQAQFALAVCGRPKLLFLDEPTVGMDVQARAAMWASLRQLVDGGASIVLTTHYIEEAEALADRVVVLAKGREIAAGTVSEMRSLVVRSRITCSSVLPVEEVAAWPGVGSVTRAAQKLSITATNPEAVVRRLLATDEVLEELEVRRAGLAEVFTELTQEVAA
ncbi:MAG TPA: ABC transporter ATP-binding protein [Bryobacteraceae bacterium]|nr:ABC transporter ATP-binding protein [Bryobacteraceae bacterium]